MRNAATGVPFRPRPRGVETRLADWGDRIRTFAFRNRKSPRLSARRRDSNSAMGFQVEQRCLPEWLGPEIFQPGLGPVVDPRECGDRHQLVAAEMKESFDYYDLEQLTDRD